MHHSTWSPAASAALVRANLAGPSCFPTASGGCMATTARTSAVTGAPANHSTSLLLSWRRCAIISTWPPGSAKQNSALTGSRTPSAMPRCGPHPFRLMTRCAVTWPHAVWRSGLCRPASVSTLAWRTGTRTTTASCTCWAATPRCWPRSCLAASCWPSTAPTWVTAARLMCPHPRS